jgi:hypothetical protein
MTLPRSQLLCPLPAAWTALSCNAEGEPRFAEATLPRALFSASARFVLAASHAIRDRRIGPFVVN